jgi:mycothiol system anti-sigma-R factor
LTRSGNRRSATTFDECSPCLRDYGIEQEVKALVARVTGVDPVPTELRERLRQRLTELVAEVRDVNYAED